MDGQKQWATGEAQVHGLWMFGGPHAVLSSFENADVTAYESAVLEVTNAVLDGVHADPEQARAADVAFRQQLNEP